jgi:hypothetical protein
MPCPIGDYGLLLPPKDLAFRKLPMGVHSGTVNCAPGSEDWETDCSVWSQRAELICVCVEGQDAFQRKTISPGGSRVQARLILRNLLLGRAWHHRCLPTWPVASWRYIKEIAPFCLAQAAQRPVFSHHLLSMRCAKHGFLAMMRGIIIALLHEWIRSKQIISLESCWVEM